MNKLKYGFYAIVAIVIGYQVWKSEVKDNINPQEEKDLSAIEKIVSKNFDPEQSIVALTFLSNDHLESKLKTVKIAYVIDNDLFTNTYNIKESEHKEEKIEAEVTPVTAGAKKKVEEELKNSELKTVKIKDIDLSLISKYFTKAVAQINEEFSENGKSAFNGFILRKFEFIVDTDGNVAGRFMIEGTQIGEAKKTVGRTTYTNYYEFEFYFDEKGELELQEEK